MSIINTLKLKTHWQTRPDWPNVSTEHYITFIEFTFTMPNQSYRVSDSDEEEETSQDKKKRLRSHYQLGFERDFHDLLELDHQNDLDGTQENDLKKSISWKVVDGYQQHMLVEGIKQLRSGLRHLQNHIHRVEKCSGADTSLLMNLKHRQKIHEWVSSLMQTKLRTLPRISA